MTFKFHNSVPCRFCGDNTIQTATRLCDSCWELYHRLEWVDPELLKKMLKEIEYESANSKRS